jgi:hypothetical protein
MSYGNGSLALGDFNAFCGTVCRLVCVGGWGAATERRGQHRDPASRLTDETRKIAEKMAVKAGCGHHAERYLGIRN